MTRYTIQMMSEYWQRLAAELLIKGPPNNKLQRQVERLRCRLLMAETAGEDLADPQLIEETRKAIVSPVKTQLYLAHIS